MKIKRFFMVAAILLFLGSSIITPAFAAEDDWGVDPEPWSVQPHID